MSDINLLPFDGEAYYINNFLSRCFADNLFNELSSQVDWKQEPIKIFGKEIMQPRLTAWIGDSLEYTYSGVTMKPQRWLPLLQDLRNKIKSKYKIEFTNALLNFYRDGQDSMGWHRDNEKELGESPRIVSISLGAQRRFDFRLYQNKSTKVSKTLEHGSLLLMQGRTQECWEHSIAKTKKVSDPRINITFRQIIKK